MRYSTGIQLEQLIVHIVNPRHSNGLVLSQRSIPLDGEQELVKYFTEHIQNSLQDSAIKAAQFSTLNDGGVVAGICKSVLHENMDLVNGSQRLAEHLYPIIEKDQRISPGNLAVCSYQTANPPRGRFLALLKIDPSDVLRQKLKIDLQGKQYVGFQMETDLMPTTRETLQKCAFIRPLEPRQDNYDMMLLDRQVQKQVAQFFTKDFLEAKLTFDEQKRTELFYEGMLSAQNSLRKELTFQEDKALRLAVDHAIRSTQVNVNQLIESLPLNEQHKQKIEEMLFDLPDREFTVDQNYVKKLTRRRRYTGDYNLKVAINAEGVEQVIRSVKPINDPGRPPYYEIIINTETWKEETT